MIAADNELVVVSAADIADEIMAPLRRNDPAPVWRDIDNLDSQALAGLAPAAVLVGVTQGSGAVCDWLHEQLPQAALVAIVDDQQACHLPALLPLVDAHVLWPPPHEDVLISVVADAVQRKIDERRQLRDRGLLSTDNQALRGELQDLTQDQQAGFRVQQGLMPESPSELAGLTFRHLLRPSLHLSGDSVDYLALPDGRVLFYIADVSGHGAAGALVTVMLKGLFQELLAVVQGFARSDSAAILEWLNTQLLAVRLEQHVTLFLGLVSADQQQLDYCNAAHFPGTILYTQQTTEYLAMGGLPLGMVPVPNYQGQLLNLPLYFTLVMFSDGVFEIMPQQDIAGKEKHLQSLVNYTKGEVDSLAKDLGLSGSEAGPDDIAIFTVSKTG